MNTMLAQLPQFARKITILEVFWAGLST